MKIVDITVTPFNTQVDRYRNGEPLPSMDVAQTITTIVTDEGAEGYYLGGHGHGDQDGLTAEERGHLAHAIRPLLIGQEPFDRERFWQWVWASKTPENLVSAVDLARGSLLGRAAGLPVHKLLGGGRDHVKASASTDPN